MRMEIKQDYITGRIDTLIRRNIAYGIHIPPPQSYGTEWPLCEN